MGVTAIAGLCGLPEVTVPAGTVEVRRSGFPGRRGAAGIARCWRLPATRRPMLGTAA